MGRGTRRVVRRKRASHNKARGDYTAAIESEGHGSSEATTAAAIHQCPFCFHIFTSGRALDSYKCSHAIATSTSASTSHCRSLF
ncbi:hypothetical protein QJS10_CPA09g00901 [Acorus calamus]|uniref:Uncharacterized protein n=1 Tax=Acorus calamus TaxID=4465 RepID=A0AAV9E344_ACOCL|nr:hypothetical protein QJS10_CPA09g00901 [Acorus calamus]